MTIKGWLIILAMVAIFGVVGEMDYQDAVRAEQVRQARVADARG